MFALVVLVTEAAVDCVVDYCVCDGCCVMLAVVVDSAVECIVD